MKPHILLLASPLCLLLLSTLQLLAIVSTSAAEIVQKVKNGHPTHWEQAGKSGFSCGGPCVTSLWPAFEELQKHFGPSETSLQSFLRVFRDAKAFHLAPSDAIQDFWRVTLTAATVERLFDTKMFHYTHTQRVGLSVVRPEDNFSIPQTLQDAVAYVDGLESFPTEMQARFMQNGGKYKNDSLAVKQQPIVDESRGQATPAVIREQYDIPTRINYSRDPSHERSSLDQVDRKKLLIGTFLHESYSQHDLYQFLHTIDGQDQVLKMPKTTGPCTSAYEPTAEASLDIQVASALTADRNGDVSDIEMMCYAQLRDPMRTYAEDNQEPFLTFLQDVNAMQPPPAVVSISYTDDECSVPIAYAKAVNRELMKAAIRGITVLVSAGDAGVQGSHLAEGFCRIPACSKFLSMFPASSPYVTAVGATTIATDSDQGKNGKWKERVTSTATNALITSGGGFSDLYDMPNYQRKAVASYLTFANTTGLSPFFRGAGRALPDVAAVGHAFPVVVNGEVSATDGTSVSAPVLASMITLLNRALPELPPLGFLNPLLYRLYDICPHVFADITQGDISCGSRSMRCCAMGHTASTGWDAASGLGTLRFSALLKDLPGCLARTRLLDDFSAAKELRAVSLSENTEDESAIHTASWTSIHLQAAQYLGVIGLIGAIGLIGVLVTLRDRVFLSSSDLSRRYSSCASHDSARERLLPH